MTGRLPPAGLYVLGFGGHARSVADVALSLGIERLLFVDQAARSAEQFEGFAVVAELPAHLEPGWGVFPAQGRNLARRAAHVPVAHQVSLVSPHATVGPGARVGHSVFIGHHAHVGPAARVGDGAIINTAAILEHEATLGAYAHLSVNAVVAGRTTIGADVFIGAGATVIDGLDIRDGVVVGAGATVVASITEPGTYVGSPARRTTIRD
jgi:UDP-N-acetylbacillosamine N-acetyltransferase